MAEIYLWAWLEDSKLLTIDSDQLFVSCMKIKKITFAFLQSIILSGTMVLQRR